MEKFQRGKRAGPVADQPSRLRTPPGVGTPLQAAGLPGQRHPLGKSSRPRGRRGTSELGRSIIFDTHANSHAMYLLLFLSSKG